MLQQYQCYLFLADTNNIEDMLKIEPTTNQVKLTSNTIENIEKSEPTPKHVEGPNDHTKDMSMTKTTTKQDIIAGMFDS